MRTIRIALGEELLGAVDRVARELRLTRSALVRQALREHLRQLAVLERERSDRDGYERKPDRVQYLAARESVIGLPTRRSPTGTGG